MLFIVLLICFAVPIQAGLVSDFRKFSGYYSYPVDIFYDGISPFVLRKCSAFNNEVAHFHQCPISPWIPFDDNDLEEYMKFSRSIQLFDSDCLFFDKLTTNISAVTNIYILGGSVTLGMHTEGCCCSIKDSVCSSAMVKQCIETFDNNGTPVFPCNWALRFGNWLQSISSNKVHIIQLARSGSTSLDTSKFIIEELRRRKIKQFTPSDMVILDHSVNDQMKQSVTDSSRILEGMENLVRIVLQMSVDSGPDIYIFEHWPHFSYMTNPRVSFKESNLNTLLTRPKLSDYPNDYGNFYRRVALYYNITLFSYRDYVWQEKFPFPWINSYNNSFINKLSKYIRLVYSKDQHPQWYIHLLWADMFSASLLKYINTKCSKYYNEYILRPTTLQPATGILKPILPKPLMDKSSASCSISGQRFLSISAVDVYYKRFDNVFGTVSIVNPHEYSSVSTGFTVMNDSKNRAGWESKIIAKESSNKLLMNGVALSSIQFTSDADFNGVAPGLNILVRVSYLRTYLNAGVMDIQICHQTVATVDTLWENFLTFRFSTAEFIDFVYSRDKILSLCSVESGGMVNVVAVHRYVSNSNPPDDAWIARTEEQRVKILSVDVCVSV